MFADVDVRLLDGAAGRPAHIWGGRAAAAQRWGRCARGLPPQQPSPPPPRVCGLGRHIPAIHRQGARRGSPGAGGAALLSLCVLPLCINFWSRSVCGLWCLLSYFSRAVVFHVTARDEVCESVSTCACARASIFVCVTMRAYVVGAIARVIEWTSRCALFVRKNNIWSIQSRGLISIRGQYSTLIADLILHFLVRLSQLCEIWSQSTCLTLSVTPLFQGKYIS